MNIPAEIELVRKLLALRQLKDNLSYDLTLKIRKTIFIIALFGLVSDIFIT